MYNIKIFIAKYGIHEKECIKQTYILRNITKQTSRYSLCRLRNKQHHKSRSFIVLLIKYMTNSQYHQF